MRRRGRDLWLGRDSRTASKPHLRRTGERGLTMIEMIATIALVSVGVVGIAGGIAATERIATVNQDQSQLEVAMRQLSDWVRDSSCDAACFTAPLTQFRALPYSYCEQASVMGTDVYNVELRAAVTANVLTPPSNTTFVITKVQESPTGSANGLRGVVGTAPQSICSPTVGDWGVQEITLKVSDPARSITRVVWKSVSW
jgi:prepilin-type N-terminal cleavage/methylation domain-containing protein